MNHYIDNDALRTQVINKSCYYTQLDKDPRSSEQLELVELESFNINTIQESINNSCTLNSFDKPLISEILDTLYKNGDKFGLDRQNNIGFYFNGKPLLRIKLTSVKPTGEILHVSLQKYRSLKHEYVTDRKFNMIIYTGVGSTILMTSLFFGMSYFRTRH